MPRSRNAELLDAEVLTACRTKCCCLPEIGLAKPTDLRYGGGAFCPNQLDSLYHPRTGKFLSVSKVRGVDRRFGVLDWMTREGAIDPSRDEVITFGEVVNNHTDGPALTLYDRHPLLR